MDVIIAPTDRDDGTSCGCDGLDICCREFIEQMFSRKSHREALRAHLVHQRVGDFEIGVDVLHVVVLVERLN